MDRFWALVTEVLNEEFVVKGELLSTDTLQQLLVAAKEQLTEPTPSDKV